MGERIKGKTLIAKDEGDDANGVLIKLYGEETNGAISIIEQPFEPGFLLPPHVHENDVWLYVLEGEMHARVSDEVVKATPGCWVLKPRRIPTPCGTRDPSRHASSSCTRRVGSSSSSRTSETVCAEGRSGSRT
jgi:ethanolamine utilization protein EutQ (cupin superfamily)